MLKKYVLFFLIVFVLHQVTIAQIIPSYVPTNGLVSWYPFSGNANDISGNTNHGSVTGAILTTDRFGLSNSSYTYNGTNNKIVVPNAGNLNPNYISVSVWVKPAVYTNSWQYIIDKSLDVSNTFASRGWAIRMTNTGIIELEFRANGIMSPVFSTTTIPLNTWSHIVFTFNGNQLKLYFNNTNVFNQNISGFVTPNTSDLSIGFSKSFVTETI